MVASATRRGITLMEVLIAIGILAVGLTSVVALVPAGQSQAARAVILDRAAVVLANGLQDAVTYGLTKPDSIAFDVGGGGPVWIIDPLVQKNGVLANTVYGNSVGAWLKPSGVYSLPSSAAGTASTLYPVTQLIGQGRDDIVMKTAPGPDDPPLNLADANGIRMFNGRMSCLFSVARADNLLNTSPGAGDIAKLTVVAFHNRDFTSTTGNVVTATYNFSTSTLQVSALPSGRTMREIVRPGVVIYDSKKTQTNNNNGRAQYLRWSQVQMASVDADSLVAFVTFSSPPPMDGQVLILLDSVGMAEQMVILEGSGPYSK